MRSLFVGILAMLAAMTGPALAQSQPPRTYTQADIWTRNEDRITFTLAGIRLPTRIGVLRLTRSVEASHEGRALDNALIFASADEEVFATVYIYAPALPDAALTAFMTDHAIKLQSGAELRTLRSGVVAAGGREGVAIRNDYAGYRPQRLASSAAFMRAGRWIIKFRISGPEARRAEVDEAMTVLLREMRFEGDTAPAPVRPVATTTCARGSGPVARPIASTSAETMEDAIMGHRLGARVEGRTEISWCPSSQLQLANMSGPTPVLRATGTTGGGDSRRSVLVALVADNGTTIEVVERHFQGRTRFVLMYHQVGRSSVLSAYASVPTDAQIQDILSGRDREGGRIRAFIDYDASGDSRVTVNDAPRPEAPQT